jgi:Resolvase, N terminal domain
LPQADEANQGEASRMNALLIGYARVSTYEQDLTAQRVALERLGVNPTYIFTDHGLTERTVPDPVSAKHSPRAETATRS